MSRGLNASFMQNAEAFLNNHPFTSALMSESSRSDLATQPTNDPPPLDFDLMEGEKAGHSVALINVGPRAATTGGDPYIKAYWLPQGKYIDIPKDNPQAAYIFTPEFSGCKIYVDEIPGNLYRIFHIQCPHESSEYAANLRGTRRGTIDNDDYGGGPAQHPSAHRVGTVRANVVIQRLRNGWQFILQGLTGIGPGIGGGAMVYPPGPGQGVGGIATKPIA